MDTFPNPETHLDADGNVAPLPLIGRKFRHTRRQKVYEVIGYAWIGDTDQWGVLHSCEGDPIYCRSVLNFIGTFDDGRPRFREIK
jgi:hypothetical protein